MLLEVRLSPSATKSMARATCSWDSPLFGGVSSSLPGFGASGMAPPVLLLLVYTYPMSHPAKLTSESFIAGALHWAQVMTQPVVGGDTN